MALRKAIGESDMLAAAPIFADQAAVSAAEMFDAIDGVDRDGIKWASSFTGESTPSAADMVASCQQQLGASSGQALYAAVRGDAEALLKEPLAVPNGLSGVRALRRPGASLDRT